MMRERKKGGDHHYVDQENQLSLWAFLHAVRIGGSPLTLTIDLRELRRRVSSLMPFGLSETGDPDVEDAVSAPISVQSIYRSWGLREQELERVRPFFADVRLREKILPLEVRRNVSVTMPSRASAKKSRRPTLGIKKPLLTK